jgi:uncharacterized tellurite resistance protein B-like protein
VNDPIDEEKMMRALRRIFASTLHMDFDPREIEELIEALEEAGYEIVSRQEGADNADEPDSI